MKNAEQNSVRQGFSFKMVNFNPQIAVHREVIANPMLSFKIKLLIDFEGYKGDNLLMAKERWLRIKLLRLFFPQREPSGFNITNIYLHLFKKSYHYNLRYLRRNRVKMKLPFLPKPSQGNT